MHNVIPMPHRSHLTTRSGKIRTTLDVKGLKMDGTSVQSLIHKCTDKRIEQAQEAVTRGAIDKGLNCTLRELTDMREHAKALVLRGETPTLAAYTALVMHSLTGAQGKE